MCKFCENSTEICFCTKFPNQEITRNFGILRSENIPQESISKIETISKNALENSRNGHCTKMKFPIKDFFSKCNQIRRKPRIWSQLLKKFLMKNFIFLCSDGVVLEILTNSGDFRRVSGFFKELFKFWNFKSLSFCVHHHLRHYLQLLEYMSKTTVRVY